MSKSTTAGPTALMTCCTAAANAAGVAQLGPSLLPDQPPKEICTLPPAALIWLIACASAPPVNGRLPSQAGVQPPLDRMNAIVNDFTPVALITAAGLGGLPHPMYRYGAPGIFPAGSGSV